MSLLDEILAKLDALPPAALIALEEQRRATAPLWLPNPGWQTIAINSEADEMFFGGEPGGGKSFLTVGAAVTQHKNSIIFRREFPQIKGLEDAAEAILGSRDGYNASNHVWRIPGADRRILEFGSVPFEKDRRRYQGRAHDLKCFDELPQFTKTQYKYLTLWLRSPDPKQRTRIIATGNPPDSPEGLWVIEYWGPWLDRNHPDPADPGELRWPVPAEEGSDKEIFFHSRDEAMEHVSHFEKPPVDHNGKLLPPRSRTFVPGKLEENPEYVKSGYQSVLAYTSQDLQDLASGDFHAGLKDHPDQVIPSAWIVDAQKRWTPRPPSGAPMSAIGVDVAQGGSDETVLAPRHDAWYAPLIVAPGKDTPMPSDVAALVVKHRRDQAAVIVDCGGGYGGGVVERLSENSIATVAHKGSNKSHGRSKCRQYTFVNKRAEVWWKFREALDPEQFGGSPIELPDEAAIRSDLAAPHFFVTPRGIQIEEKEETKKRIGRSPDKGDAIVMAWAEGQEALRRGISGPGAMPKGMGPAHQNRPAFANVGYRNAKRRH